MMRMSWTVPVRWRMDDDENIVNGGGALDGSERWIGWTDDDNDDADGTSNMLVMSSVEVKQVETDKERIARSLANKATEIVHEIIAI
jgi:hypothetical protein